MAIARYKSCLGSNVLFCCNYFNWRSDEFLLGNIDLRNEFFVEFSDKSLSFVEFSNANSVFELLCIREGVMVLEDERVRSDRIRRNFLNLLMNHSPKTSNYLKQHP